MKIHLAILELACTRHQLQCLVSWFGTRQTHMSIIFSEISTNQKKINIHPYPEKPATAPLHGLGSHAWAPFWCHASPARLDPWKSRKKKSREDKGRPRKRKNQAKQLKEQLFVQVVGFRGCGTNSDFVKKPTPAVKHFLPSCAASGAEMKPIHHCSILVLLIASTKS